MPASVDNYKQPAMAHGPSLYVGLDFITHQSGFGTAALGSSVRFMEVYPDQPVPYCKTLSMLLYCKIASGWKPVSWGWSAYLKYQLMRPAERHQHVLLDR